MRKLRKRMLAVLLAAVMAVGLFPTFASQAQAAGSAPGSGSIQAEFFVSPNGSDENPGTYERPFATLTAARDAVRKINRSMTGDIYVFLAAGDYYIDETIRFDERDSGTNGHRIIYRNLDGLDTVTVTNCVIHDIGELVGQASGFTIQSSGYNTVSHMEIYNSPRRGIFLTAGHWREYEKHYSDDLSQSGDLNYDMMKHLYTHHNRIEYVYLHDCQQDGGGDGAIFACYLFCPSWGQNNPTKGSRPNYISQVVVDSIGGNPTMLDIAPNGINLDMGCDGFVLENVNRNVSPANNCSAMSRRQYGLSHVGVCTVIDNVQGLPAHEEDDGSMDKLVKRLIQNLHIR